MTSADRNDLMPAQEKLEWVTPKISLMGAEKTASGKVGKFFPLSYEKQLSRFSAMGPS
jgi:hypothetical protein